MAFAVLKNGATPLLSARTSARRSVHCRASASSNERAKNMNTTRRVFVGMGLATTLISVPLASQAKDSRVGEVQHTEKEWLQILGEDAYYIMRQEGTERPRSSNLNYEKRKGTFVCAGCSTPLFDMSTKFDSGTGWPSFYKALPGAVDETSDYSLPFMARTEVRCHTCQGHLGHVFNDGPAPTGLRYCMNGLSMAFKPAGEA